MPAAGASLPASSRSLSGDARASEPDAPGATSERWLFGPAADLFLGCGGGYVVFAALLLSPGVVPHLAPWLLFATALLGLVTNTPHYGATLLRVYEHRSDRRRYALFAVHASVLLFGLFAAGLYWPPLGSLLVTIYVTWSPWHFAGQNYGLALIFLRRRGVTVDARTKRLLYASFVLSFVLALLALHGGVGHLSAAPVPADLFGRFAFLSLGLPDTVTRPALWIAGAAYVGTLLAAGTSLLHRARAADLAPSLALVLLQSLWFAIPALLVLGGGMPRGMLALSTIWIAMFHSIQYLWVTSYYARRTDGGATPAYLGKAILAGAGVTVLPSLLFAPDLLGTVPFDVGMAGLLFAMVNIHHFLLDGAIWKLRDGRVARALLRSEPVSSEPTGPESRVTRSLAWAACVAALGVALLHAWEVEFGMRRADARGDLARMETATQRLGWIGRDHHALHFNLGLALARSGQTQEARRHLERSLELFPTAQAYTTLGNLERIQGRYPEALEALDAAIARDASLPTAYKRRGETLAEMGRPREALEALREAQRLAPDDANIRAAIERVSRELDPTYGASGPGGA